MANTPRASLWRDADFLKLWTGQTVSIFGSLIGQFALSLTAIVVLGASASDMAVLRAAELLPALLVGLVAGVWVDRLRRRPLLIVADLGRAVALGWLPLAAWLGILRIEHLYAVVAVVSVLTLVFDVACRAYLPALIPRDRLVESNGKLQATGSVAEVAGFGLAGALVQALTAPLTILIDALSFVLSAAALALIRRGEPPARPPAERESAVREVQAGLRLVAHEPLPRTLAVLEALRAVFGAGMFGTLIMLYLADDLALDPVTLGVLFALGGLSALGGALSAAPVARRWGVGPALVWGYAIHAAALLLVPLAGGPLVVVLALLALQQALGDGAYTVLEVSQTSLLQACTSVRLLGRLYACLALLGRLGTVVGIVLAGLLGELLGPRAALLVAALGSLAAATWLAASPVRQLRAPPLGADEVDPARP